MWRQRSGPERRDTRPHRRYVSRARRERVTYRRCGRVSLRTDDMLVVRGVNVYPSAVENILRGFDAVREYRVEIQNHRTLPELSIQVEAAPAHAHDSTLTHRLEAALTNAFALRIPVSVVPQGSLPRFEMKARRWVHT